jgi:hypothetical protein
MTSHLPGRIWLLRFVVAVFFVGSAVQAQTVGPDEAVDARGAVTQKLALTAAQKNAIYNAVLGQRVRTSTTGIPLAIGAPVSPSAVLLDLPVEALPVEALPVQALSVQALPLANLPDQAEGGDPGATVLKYAMVEGKVVVIDAIHMRVVDVINGGAISGAIP